MSIADFIAQRVDGEEPQCCFLELANFPEYKQLGLVLHAGRNRVPWTYSPKETDPADIYYLACRELDKNGWRVFVHKWEWEAYRSGESLREPATFGEIAAAEEAYASGSDDNIEIDQDAMYSKSDNGYWVQAWVYVANEEEEEEEEDDEA
jgi:hypothetical protein